MVFDYIIVGHYHQPFATENLMMNGSFQGGSDLSINKMITTSRASQKVFYFNPEHGVHRESNIFLDKRLNLTTNKDGIYTSIV